MMKRTAQYALILLALGVALPQLWYPYGFDQMVYAACGDVIRRGGVPIRDCFETKQMGVMVMYSIPMLFTRAPMAVHAFTLLWQAITSLGLGAIAQRVHGSAWSAWAAALLYWLMYAGINYWSMDQAETFANALLLLAFWWMWRDASAYSRQGGPRTMALAGLCIGIAFWFKYVFALIGLALGAVWLLYGLMDHSRRRACLQSAAAYGAGVFGVIALVLGWYTLQPGGWDALQQQLNFLRENFPLAEPLPPSGMAEQMLRFLNNGADVSGGYKETLGVALTQANIFGGGFPLMMAMATLGFLRGLHKGGAARVASIMLMAYLIACIVIVIWQGNYIQYHYTLLHVPVALLAAGALASNANGLARGALAATLALLLWRVTPLVRDAWQNVVVEGKSAREMYLESRSGAHISIGDFLREHTAPSDTISVFGDAPWIYTLSERANATRFSFINVWIKKRDKPSYGLFTGQWVQDLQRNTPIYVILVKDNFPWANNSTLDDYKANKAIFDYVEGNYQYEGDHGPFLLFRRK